MRIAVANWSCRKVGGTEGYLEEVIGELSSLGHQVAFLYECDRPVDRGRIALTSASPRWCVDAIGLVAAGAALREWRPDIIYAHKLENHALHDEILAAAPALLFIHDYYGTCISGLKAFRFPAVAPCDRRFGWQCLARYFPQRCGGRSPLTMWKLFRLQSQRLEVLGRYPALLTHSDHMRAELLKHGLDPGKVHKSTYLVEPLQVPAAPGPDSGLGDPVQNRPLRLLFVGRMDRLKGGAILLKALPQVAQQLQRPVLMTFAGDGPERSRWKRRAMRLEASNCHLKVEFPGWLDGTSLRDALTLADLLVVPSLWPEPFGRVGPEAGLRSVPVVAFDVGGISEWLIDGVNGRLASGHPPAAAGLARAIVECVSDPMVHARLRHGALEVARRFNVANHVGQLLQLFEQVGRQSAGDLDGGRSGGQDCGRNHAAAGIPDPRRNAT